MRATSPPQGKMRPPLLPSSIVAFVLVASAAFFRSGGTKLRADAFATIPTGLARRCGGGNRPRQQQEQQQQRQAPSPRRAAAALRSSSSAGDGGTGEDDEISKLIGKRSQIKRKRKEELEAAAAAASETKLDEAVVDIDLDKLPEFRTERPVRRAKSKDGDGDDDDEEGGGDTKGKGKSKSSDLPIVDFKADYDDENDFHIPNRMGVTTSCWGDPDGGFVPQGKLTKRMIKSGMFVPGDVQLAYTKLLEGGVTFIDTAPSYGSKSRRENLTAEHMLRRCLEEQEDDLPDPMIMVGLGTSSWRKILAPGRGISNSLSDSVDKLGGTASVEIFQAPASTLFPSRLLARGLNAAMETGCCSHVGARNIRTPWQLRRLCNKLDDSYGLTLTSNSFDYSMTNPRLENMIDACKSMNVIPLVTDPLDGGLSSGVYTATNPSGGGRTSVGGGNNKRGGGFTFARLEKLQPLHSVQETVAERARARVSRELRDLQDRFRSRYGPPPKINTDITTTQVALNYVVAKGGVPLPEVNSPRQAEEVLGCLGWTLTEEEVEMLDAAIALCNL